MQKNLQILEEKLVGRQDDVIRALTKKLADREETIKKFRLTNNYIKNIYDVVKFMLLIEEKKASNHMLKQIRTELFADL